MSFTLEGRKKHSGRRGARAAMAVTEGRTFLVECWISHGMMGVVCGVEISVMKID